MDHIGGDDIIKGYGGDDELFGGPGNDILYGGIDDDCDTLYGGLGDDILIDESGESGEEGFYFGDDKERSPYGGNDKIYGNDG